MTRTELNIGAGDAGSALQFVCHQASADAGWWAAEMPGEVELADAVIRIADLAGGLGLDLGGAIAEKLAFNAVRPDHKPEARAVAGGKSY